MGGRRDEVDPVLAELVRERLARLLAEQGPRRARAAESVPVRRVDQVPRAAPGSRTDRVIGAAAASTPPRGLRALAPAVLTAGPAEAVGAPRALGAAVGPPDFEPSEDDEEPTVGAQRFVGPSADGSQHRWYGESPPAWVSPRPPRPGLLLDSDDVGEWGAEIPDLSPVPARRSFNRTHVGVVSALLLVALLWGGWSVLRARPVALASSTVTSRATPFATRAGTIAPSARAASASPTSILVHVLGAVRHPGVVTLTEHARVRDALRAAGGLRRDARPGELNLAQVLSDGQQVVIGTSSRPAGEVRDESGSTAGGSTAGGAKSGDAAGSPVDLNSATEAQLEGLPGVGPVMAAKILAWKEEHGRFSRVEELQEVDGVGPKTYAQIAPHARV